MAFLPHFFVHKKITFKENNMEKYNKAQGVYLLCLKADLKCKKAFSLIEILISLIIISLLIAAFTPIITKKLKASDISIGSFGSGSNINMTLERQVTKEDCDKYDAIFIPAAMNGGTRNLCVTRYNVGDNIDNGGVPIAKSAKTLSVGSTCNDHLNCCWQGATANSCANGDSNSDYSGCNRTVCGWQAANASCAAYAPDNENEGSWRLPTKEEILNWQDNFSNLQTNKGKEGLQLCSYEAIDGYTKCSATTACNDTGLTHNGCHPHHIFSNNAFDTFALNRAKFDYSNSENITYSAGARCVLDKIAVDVSELPNGGGIKDPTVDPFYGEPKDQADCDKVVAIFIDKKMSGANRNICVSKYNVGDAGPDGFGPPIPESFNQYIMNAGQTCPYNGNCCWKGKTANACGITGNAGANYSGCNRTVCQYNAANAACRQYNAFGATAVGAWRLPTGAEFSVWMQYMKEISNNKGPDGLQLCVSGTSAGYVQCANIQNCPGFSSVSGWGAHCTPFNNWTSTIISKTYQTYNTAGGVFGGGNDIPASARCVYDGITKANNYEEDLSDYDDSNAPKDEPKSQADCDKLTAIFIHKKYAGGSRNLCISKYNVGDSGPSGSGPTIPSAYNTYIMNAAQSCPYNGYCCWKGRTANACGITGNVGANYSGCNRTVCQWHIANESCLLWTAGGKTQARAWRLPTQAEFTNIVNYMNIINNDRGADGLQLCVSGTNAGYVQCANIQNCPGFSSVSGWGAHCTPFNNWTSTTGLTYDAAGNAYSGGADIPASARCVYDGTINKPSDIGDYDESNAPDDEPKSQADCDKLTAIFVHKKYSGDPRNICISKYNVGDTGPSGSGPQIPTQYAQYTINAAQACGKSGYCCWKGKTANSCGIVGNAGADYSGCNRTVCQWYVSDAACKEYTAGGKTQAGYWRLPTQVEFSSMFQYMGEINNNRGKNGIQLCTSGTNPGFVQCANIQNCPGFSSVSGWGAHCTPFNNWTSTLGITYNSIGNTFSGGADIPASARCVYDGTKVE